MSARDANEAAAQQVKSDDREAAATQLSGAQTEQEFNDAQSRIVADKP